MAEVASAFVSLMPSAKGFGKSTQRQIGPQMNSVAKTTGSRFGKVFAYSSMSPLKAIGAAAIGLFAVQKIKDFFGSAISEARESQKVSAITAQVIKSTGGAAGVSAGQVGRLATSISNLTGIDDEAIQSGSNLLLTFTNLRNEAGKGNDVFNQATKVITDMSVALGTDVKGSAIQVGKALNDPIKGISALTRVGVAFTDQQKAQITALTNSGNRLAAQKIILRELRKEFGGTAAAAATAGDKFKTTFANFQESIGTFLLPYLDKLLLKGIQVIGFLQKDLPAGFATFKAAIMPAIEVVRSFVEDHLQAFKVGLAALGGSALTSVITLLGGTLVSAIGVLVGALASPIALIGALAGAAVYAYVHFSSFRDAVNGLAISARDNLLPALQVAAQYVVTNVVPALMQAGNVLRTDVLPIVRGFVMFMATEFYPTMIKAWAVVAQKLVPVFVALGQMYVARVLPVQRQVLAQIREYGPAVGPAVTNITRMIAALAVLGATISGKTLPPAIRLATALSGPMVAALLAAMRASNQAEVAIGQFGRSVVQAIAKAVGAIQSLPGKAKAALGNAGTLLYSAGQDLMRGFINGVKSMAGELASAAKAAAKGAVDGVKGFLHIGSPSKLMHQIGKWTIEGFANGIIELTPKVVAAALDASTKVQAAFLDRLTSMRDGVKGVLDGLKSDFASLRDSIASTFAGNLFEATSGLSFMSNLQDRFGNLSALKGAFRTLRKWGLDPAFLSQLFASGNSALILDMASGSRGDARYSADLFGEVNSLSRSLGTSVARNDIGPDIKGMRQELRDINKVLQALPKNFGKEINGAATAGHRKRAA